MTPPPKGATTWRAYLNRIDDLALIDDQIDLDRLDYPTFQKEHRPGFPSAN